MFFVSGAIGAFTQASQNEVSMVTTKQDELTLPVIFMCIPKQLLGIEWIGNMGADWDQDDLFPLYKKPDGDEVGSCSDSGRGDYTCAKITADEACDSAGLCPQKSFMRACSDPRSGFDVYTPKCVPPERECGGEVGPAGTVSADLDLQICENEPGTGEANKQFSFLELSEIASAVGDLLSGGAGGLDPSALPDGMADGADASQIPDLSALGGRRGRRREQDLGALPVNEFATQKFCNSGYAEFFNGIIPEAVSGDCVKVTRSSDSGATAAQMKKLEETLSSMGQGGGVVSLMGAAKQMFGAQDGDTVELGPGITEAETIFECMAVNSDGALKIAASKPRELRMAFTVRPSYEASCMGG